MSDTTHQGTVALGSSMLALAAITTAGRFYTRTKQNAPLKIDDWLTILCLFFLAGTVGTEFYAVHKGVVGYPTPKDPQLVIDTAALNSKLFIAFDIFSVATLACTKLSALFFYRRVFSTEKRGGLLEPLILISVAIVILWMVAFELLSGLQCGTHFSALWTSPTAYDKYCEKTSYPFLLGYVISDFLLDLWIICLPIPSVWELKTTRSRRFGIIAVFFFALVSLAANIVRLVVFVQVEETESGGPNAAASIDVRLVDTKAEFYTQLEVGMACIVVNLPSLWFSRGKVAPEMVVHSVRSTVSLASLESPGSVKDRTRESNIPVESHVMYDIERNDHPQLSENVHITKTGS